MKSRDEKFYFLNKIVSLCAAAVMIFSCTGLTAHSSGIQPEDLYQEYAEKIVILVNEARAEEGLKPLYAVPVLYDASNVRANESITLFSHNRPDETFFNTVLDEFGLEYWAAAENIAAGSSTPEATFNQWKNSPNHWRSIMNPDYTHMGAGVVFQQGTTYGWYWEQIFVSSNEMTGQYVPERYKVVPKSYGDINGDGAVDVFDYALLVKRIRNEVILNDLQEESADCMKDGVLTIADAVVLRKYLLGIYDTLPVSP